MSWETVISNALSSFSNFVSSFFDIIGGSVNAEALEGLIVLFAIGIFYRICQGGAKIPKLRRKDEDEDEEEEYVLVRRRRK